MRLAIKMNDSIAPRACPLCGRICDPNIGPELTLERDMLVVCRDCGWVHAPALTALLELAWAAEDFSYYAREFGDRWHASMEARMRRRVD
jgi:hypothetical protein